MGGDESSEKVRIRKPANRRTLALFIGVLGVILGPPIVALFALTLRSRPRSTASVPLFILRSLFLLR